MSDLRRRAPSPYSQTLSRAVPTPAQPPSDARQGSYVTEPKTFLTLAGKISQIVPATRQWVRVTFTLETAGPVEISSSSNWVFLSGQGQALITNVPLPYVVPRGNNIYIQAGASNRVKYTIEPYPWLEEIWASIRNGFDKQATAMDSLTAAWNAFNELVGRKRKAG